MSSAFRATPLSTEAASAAERRREQILAAAAHAFATHGYANTDVGDLADQLGVGKGTIYRTFPRKSELFLAAVDRAMRLLQEAIGAASDHEPDSLTRIRLAIEAYLSFFASNPEFVELLIIERAEFRDRRVPTYFEHRAANRAKWQGVYEDLMAAGVIRRMPVEQVMDVMSHLAYGTMFTNFFVGASKPPAAQAAEILDVVFQGLLSRADSSSPPGARSAPLPPSVTPSNPGSEKTR